MAGDNVTDLVGDHPGKFRLIGRRGNERRRDEDLSRRHGKGVNVRHIHHSEVIVIRIALQIVRLDDLHP